jgi:hypothetical protein
VNFLHRRSVIRRNVIRRNVIRRIAFASVFLLGVSLFTACGSKAENKSNDEVIHGNGGPDELFAETASFETVALRLERVMVGLSTADGRVLHGGSIDITFTPPSDTDASNIVTTATFLAVPMSAVAPATATIGLPSAGIGIYAAKVTFSRPGIWLGAISVPGTKQKGLDFPIEVKAESKLPDLGKQAPRTKNPIGASGLTAEQAVKIDSRSGPNGLGSELTDPILHNDVIADLLDAHHPFIVIVSTPTFCQSKFCGPLTDMVQVRADEKRPTEAEVAFVHLEVWDDFATGKVNAWAAEWIDDGVDGREPWVFAVNRKGQIAARFDNLLSPEDLDYAIGQITG